jgi:hypothetical protein
MDWLAIGSTVLKHEKKLSPSQFRYHFKLQICLLEYLWKRLTSHFQCDPKHLLWTLHFLKSKDPNEQGIASILNTDKKTLRLHVVETLEKLLKALPKVCIIFVSVGVFLLFTY